MAKKPTKSTARRKREAQAKAAAARARTERRAIETKQAKKGLPVSRPSAPKSGHGSVRQKGQTRPISKISAPRDFSVKEQERVMAQLSEQDFTAMMNDYMASTGQPVQQQGSAPSASFAAFVSDDNGPVLRIGPTPDVDESATGPEQTEDQDVEQVQTPQRQSRPAQASSADSDFPSSSVPGDGSAQQESPLQRRSQTPDSAARSSPSPNPTPRQVFKEVPEGYEPPPVMPEGQVESDFDQRRRETRNRNRELEQRVQVEFHDGPPPGPTGASAGTSGAGPGAGDSSKLDQIIRLIENLPREIAQAMGVT